MIQCRASKRSKDRCKRMLNGKWMCWQHDHMCSCNQLLSTKEVILLPCNHYIHQECALKAARSTSQCPVCNAIFLYSSSIPEKCPHYQRKSIMGQLVCQHLDYLTAALTIQQKKTALDTLLTLYQNNMWFLREEPRIWKAMVAKIDNLQDLATDTVKTFMLLGK